MSDSPLAQLAIDFAIISLIAVGGVNGVLPEMQRTVVEVHGWMDASMFADLYALAQAAPGPNLLVVSLIGWKVAGFAGAAVATAAVVIPSSVLTYAVAAAWQRFRDAHWRRAIQRGLAPVTVGLTLSGAYLITQAADESAAAYALTAFTTLVVLNTRLNPVWLIVLGAVLGLAGVV